MVKGVYKSDGDGASKNRCEVNKTGDLSDEKCLVQLQKQVQFLMYQVMCCKCVWYLRLCIHIFKYGLKGCAGPSPCRMPQGRNSFVSCRPAVRADADEEAKIEREGRESAELALNGATRG